MAETPFQIPGLGHAKPNEILPVESFDPDLLVAAASIVGDGEVAVGGTNGAVQWEREQQKKEQQEEAANTATASGAAGDGMEVDIKDNSTQTATTRESQDAKMHDQESKDSSFGAADVDMDTANDAPSPDVTHALEAALNGMLSQVGGSSEPAQAPSHAEQQQGPVSTEQQQQVVFTEQLEQQQPAEPQGQQEQAEWEADSSPYESSSESSSSDSSSDDDSEDEGGYALLGIEETARLLMAADGEGDGDVDGAGRSKGAGAALRTKNEVAEEVIPKPDVTITPEMRIEQLGNIEFVVENTIVIKSHTPGEIQVLDSGSVLCKEDRTVIGALAEVLGNVRSPMYTVGFSSENEVKEQGLVVGLPIYYSVEHANYVFTQPLKEAKGTDASNLHDEEVAADEMEFSDDEKEAEYKRQQKLKKRGGKAGRGGREGSFAPSHTMSPHPAGATGLNYDEDDDGPYKPLSRPPGYGQGGPPSLPPKPETGFSSPRGGRGHGHRGAHRGGRGDFRGRGHRGGPRGGGDRRHGSRGSGSGGYPPFGHDGASSPQSPYSVVPPPPPQNPHLPPPPFGAKPPAPAGQWPTPPASFIPPASSYPHSPPARQPVPQPHHQPPAGQFNFNYQAWNQNQGQHYQYPPAPSHHPAPRPQQPTPATGYAQPYGAPQAAVAPWPAAGTAPAPAPAPPATGTYNAAYYGSYQQPQQAPQGQQYWPQQPHGGYGQGPSQ